MGPVVGIECRRITGALGAEVTGADLANPSDSMIEQLRKAWLDHKVLVIRDQHISREEHIAFGRCFGELEIHPFASNHKDYPEIVRIKSNEKFQYAASSWHTDVTWRPEPSMGSILRGVEIPPVGGDTSFANSAMAYERLPDDVKDFIADRHAIHDFSMTFGRGMTDAERTAKQQEHPPARHPIVRTHPETGEKSLYTSRNFISSIEGVEDEAEFDRLMESFDRAIMNPSVQCRVKWQPDTFVMWDNRAVHHHASDDFWPETRHVERVTICGEKPF